MDFKDFLVESQAWDEFVDAHFINEFENLQSDFYCWLRHYGLGTDCEPELLEKYFKEWSRSGRRGRWCQTIDRKRRQAFGPGKFYAASPSGVHLNQNFVQGWRGVNPKRPGGGTSL